MISEPLSILSQDNISASVTLPDMIFTLFCYLAQLTSVFHLLLLTQTLRMLQLKYNCIQQVIKNKHSQNAFDSTSTNKLH